MPATHIEELKTDAEWDGAVPILRQLWTDANEAFVRSWREEDGYRLFGCYDDGTLVGVTGVSIQRVLHHARHAWIHDFVIDEDRRGEGFGAELVAFAEEWAREQECEYVALALRDGNDDARRFYEDNGMERWGEIIEREL